MLNTEPMKLVDIVDCNPTSEVSSLKDRELTFESAIRFPLLPLREIIVAPEVLYW